jgi:hypothetical protein
MHPSFSTRVSRSALKGGCRRHSPKCAIGALTFELRIATDLAAHCIATGRRPKAVRLLAPIYEKLAEGFETQDLVAASRLLQGAQRQPVAQNIAS